MSDNRPPVYWEDDVLVIRASAIGTSCLWELIAAGQGYEQGPVPDNLQRAFDEGNKLEPVILGKLQAEKGVTFLSHQEEGELQIDDNLIIRYHSDGIGRVLPWVFNDIQDTIYVVEVKALSHEVWLSAVRNGVGSVFAEYPWQLSVMMHDTGLPGLWGAYNKGTPPINDMGDRELCQDEGKLYVQRVPTPPIPLSAIVAKAMQIRELVQGSDVVESGRPCDDPSHYPCRYLALRPEPEETSAVLEVSGEEAAPLDSLAREYLTYKGMVDEATARLDNAKKELIAQAGDGVSKIVTDRFVIPVLDGRGQSRMAIDEMNAKDREDYDRLCRKYMRPGKKYRYLRGVKGRE